MELINAPRAGFNDGRKRGDPRYGEINREHSAVPKGQRSGPKIIP